MQDIDELLFPISDNNLCGTYLKYDYIYDQIKEHRREDDHRLPQGVWQTEQKKASWPDVIKICSDALKNKTKDLQIAMWMTEAMTALYGFRGFHNGILLLQKMCEKFWDGMYPSIEGENFYNRMAPFYFFAEKMPEKILLVHLTSQDNNISENYSLSDWITARHNLHIKNNDGLTLDIIKESAVSTSLDFFKKLESQIIDVVNDLKKLETFLLNKCQDSSPSFRVIYEYFEDIKNINAKNLKERESLVQTEKSDASSVKKNIEASGGTNVEDQALNEISKNTEERGATLDQAYTALQEIADFLEHNQPQSPASILIKVAASIGKKTFQELLEINMKSGTSVMATISELYNILK